MPTEYFEMSKISFRKTALRALSVLMYIDSKEILREYHVVN